MRLIGNKSRLLQDIEEFLRDRGVLGGTFIDIFSGTGSVGRHFKSLGYKVVANDRLSACFTKAVAEIEVCRYPTFADLWRKDKALFEAGAPLERQFLQSDLFEDDPGDGGSPRRGSRAAHSELRLAYVLDFLQNRLEPREGLVYRNYCPGGGHGRKYFRDENGRRVDAILHFLRENHRGGLLTRGELHLVLSSLLDAADRVANISGTYGAYLKTWQRNALAPLKLRLPKVTVSSLRHRAFREDANRLVRKLRGDILYIDPPYNRRQYAANYHVLDIIAEYHAIDNLDAYEAMLYGKTGLRPYKDLKSDYCIPPTPRSRSRISSGGDVLSAMTDLILSSKARHVLVSYNEEGLLTREELGAILCRFSGQRVFDFTENMRTVSYRRFCSDSDRAVGAEKGKRRYRVLEGKARGEISEWLLFASRGRAKVSSRKVSPAKP
jgi:adenine-specific DNA-methyltransferase